MPEGWGKEQDQALKVLIPSLGLVIGITKNLESSSASSRLPSLLQRQQLRDAVAKISPQFCVGLCLLSPSRSPKCSEGKKISACIGIFIREDLRWGVPNSLWEDGGFSSPGFPLSGEERFSLFKLQESSSLVGAALPAVKSAINGNKWK